MFKFTIIWYLPSMKSKMAKQSTRIVLVVDDDQPTLSFVTECIAQMGHKVFSAASGEEAMEIIHNQGVEVDLLLSDVVMPGMNGIELAQTLVANAPETKIIFMSGYMQPALSLTITAKYERGFIQKPFSGKTLTNHVKKALTELGQDTSQ